MAYRCYFRCPRCHGVNRVPSDRLHKEPICGRCGERLDPTGAPFDVDDDTFDKLIVKAPVPLLVDFWAPWCQPCKMMAPALERLGAHFVGRLWILKINTDEHQRKMAEFGIRSIPTMYLFKDQRIVVRKQGARSFESLKSLAERHVDFYE